MRRIRVFVSAAVLATMAMLTELTPANAQTTVWGLQPRDRFQVETTVQRTSVITLGDAPATRRKVTDRFVLEYVALPSLRDGGLSIRIQIVQAERSTVDPTDEKQKVEVQQPTTLRNLAFVAIVDEEGLLRALPQYDQTLNHLAGVHHGGLTLLERCVPQDVFFSWIELPFWMTPPVDDANAESIAELKWQRQHQTSLGAIGQLQVIAECQTQAAEDGVTKVSITGTPRFLPTDLPADENFSRTLEFQDVKFESNAFSGEGVIVEASEDDTEEEVIPGAVPGSRPPFQSLKLSTSCSGTGTVHAPKTKQALRFQQQQTIHCRLLPGYRVGGFADRMLYPLPQRPR